MSLFSDILFPSQVRTIELHVKNDWHSKVCKQKLIKIELDRELCLVRASHVAGGKWRSPIEYLRQLGTIIEQDKTQEAFEAMRAASYGRGRNTQQATKEDGFRQEREMMLIELNQYLEHYDLLVEEL